MAITLDGVVAPEKDDAFDHSDEGVWGHIFGLLESVDTMLIGAGMHEVYLNHWHAALTNPSSPNEGRFAKIAAQTPHLVLSRRQRTLHWPNASLLANGVAGIPELKKQAGRNIIMWGGATAAAAAIEAGVVDEYHFVTHPVIAGRGKKLFSNVEGTRRLRHQETKTLPSGIVLLRYAAA
jgi:dihydrofolate reductase